VSYKNSWDHIKFAVFVGRCIKVNNQGDHVAAVKIDSQSEMRYLLVEDRCALDLLLSSMDTHFGAI